MEVLTAVFHKLNPLHKSWEDAVLPKDQPLMRNILHFCQYLGQFVRPLTHEELAAAGEHEEKKFTPSYEIYLDEAKGYYLVRYFFPPNHQWSIENICMLRSISTQHLNATHSYYFDDPVSKCKVLEVRVHTSENPQFVEAKRFIEENIISIPSSPYTEASVAQRAAKRARIEEPAAPAAASRTGTGWGLFGS